MCDGSFDDEILLDHFGHLGTDVLQSLQSRALGLRVDGRSRVEGQRRLLGDAVGELRRCWPRSVRIFVCGVEVVLALQLFAISLGRAAIPRL